MHLHRRALAGLAAATVLALAAGGATANRLSISNRTFRVVWTPLTIKETVEITCNVTFEGSIHTAAIAKTAGALIGYVTLASAEGCSKPTLTGLGMPWHIKYSSFAGLLPNITGVRVEIVEAAFLLRPAGPLEPELACLYRSTAAKPLRATANLAVGGRITSLSLDSTAAIPLSRQLGGFPTCEPEIKLQGEGAVTLQGNATTITITLV